MRSNIINIRANIAAVVARVNAVVVDVIRSASATGLRLYGHTWQPQYGPTWFKPTTLNRPIVMCHVLLCDV